jgi:hypothetical protein
MTDLKDRLEALSERGTEIGSEQLRDRVVLDLANGAPSQSLTGPKRRFPGPVVAVAAAALVLALIGTLAGVALLLSAGEDTTTPGQPVVTSTFPPVTTAPPPPPTTIPVQPSTTLLPAADLSARLWEAVPGNEGVFDNAQVGDVIHSQDAWVAVGSVWEDGRPEAAVWLSPDGLTWNRVPHDDSLGVGAAEMNAVTDAGPGLVAVGHACDDPENTCGMRPVAWTSEDGQSWQRVPHDPDVFGLGGRMVDVEQYDGRIVSIGLSCDSSECSAAGWTSTDGFTWTRDWYGEANTEPLSMAADGPLVVVGTEYLSDGNVIAAVWTSGGEGEWSRIPHDNGVFGAAASWFDIAMTSVTGTSGFEGVGFVAIGWVTTEERVGQVWISPDGSRWSVAAQLSEEAFGAVRSSDGVAVAVGQAIWRSTDGVSWEQVAQLDTFAHALTHSESRWIVTQTGPRPWVSPPPS